MHNIVVIAIMQKLNIDVCILTSFVEVECSFVFKFLLFFLAKYSVDAFCIIYLGFKMSVVKTL